MNPNLNRLQPYPFEKLARLTQDTQPPADLSRISLSIGEPRHAAPDFLVDAVAAHTAQLSAYPATRGTAELRQAIAGWANNRFGLASAPLDPERHVLPVCGSREALFSVAQATIDSRVAEPPVVMMPNPFYQIYEGAALLAGAEPYYLNTFEADGYLPDFDQVPDEIWRRTQLLYLCSPGNPTGAVLDRALLRRALELAERHDFMVGSDECYSEIYFDEAAPPPGLLEVAADLGIQDYRRCIVFHSLSKRSNLPGLRSGFVAGDGAFMEGYLRYRTYHGSAMPGLSQAVSAVAWRDETHVRENRELYRKKFEKVLPILSPVMQVSKPDAGFYLWPQTPIDEEQFARELLARENVMVLPGSYLSRAAQGADPGKQRVRMALVAEMDECVEAAQRIRRFVENL
jgi:N-succinyldiaminopimelate aminotransferase